jgi:hypothetical protein
MEATKLPLTKWFQAFYLVGDAKTGISSLSLMGTSKNMRFLVLLRT